MNGKFILLKFKIEKICKYDKLIRNNKILQKLVPMPLNIKSIVIKYNHKMYWTDGDINNGVRTCELSFYDRLNQIIETKERVKNNASMHETLISAVQKSNDFDV